MFDTHTHLSDERLVREQENILANAKQSGVSAILTVCADSVEIPAFENLLKGYNFIYGAIGIHPHNAKEWNSSTRDQLCRWLTQNKIVALGEIGLDYHYNFSIPELQQATFRQQLKIAKEKKLPVIIHSREATKDTLKILQEENICYGVMHCYSGTVEEMHPFLEMGLYISLSGVVTFTNAKKTQEVATRVPLERLLIETDCPYLAPQPVRGKSNEPAFIKYTFEKIAELRGISIESLIESTTNNAKQLFRILH